MERLVIGVDIDGVVVDYVTAALPLFSKVCGRPVSYQEFYCRDIGKCLGIDTKTEAYCWEQILSTDLLRYAPPIKGAIGAFSKLRKHEIWLVTGRPLSMQGLTTSWLNEKDIKYDRITFSSGKSKGMLSLQRDFDVFIEDQLEVACLMAEAGVFTLLLNQPWNQASTLPENCQRVSDWNAVVLAINKLESQRGTSSLL
jgi:uncharacterized HAD superfamily protein